MRPHGAIVWLVDPVEPIVVVMTGLLIHVEKPVTRAVTIRPSLTSAPASLATERSGVRAGLDSVVTLPRDRNGRYSSPVVGARKPRLTEARSETRVDGWNTVPTLGSNEISRFRG